MKHTVIDYREFSEHKGLIFLTMIYVVVTAVPTLFLYRMVEIGPFMFPGGMFIFPLIYVIGDVIAEVYGYKVARMVIWFSLVANFTFALAILSALYLPYPAGEAHVANEYIFVFHGVLRGDIANLVGVLCGRFINAYLLTRWKVWVRGKIFIVRSFVSSATGELIMLSVWILIAFSGKLNAHQMLHVAMSDYAVRLSYALLFAIPAAWIVKYLKSLDHVDIYDTDTNFNPFSLAIK